jgi:predicted SAM-dependent methyltransferase
MPWLRPLAYKIVSRTRRFRNRTLGPTLLRHWLQRGKPLRFVIGAAGKGNPGWFSTDEQFLDLTRRDQWASYFSPGSISALMAEHVWEHMTPEEAEVAASIVFDYLRPGGYFRVAVPDGFHPDPTYQEGIRVGGALPGQHSNDHKVLYTYATLRAHFERAGFVVTPYEYFDEKGVFHYAPWHPRDGFIRRSRDHDKRNRRGNPLVYTSIVLDAVKPAAGALQYPYTQRVPSLEGSCGS